MTLHGTLFRPSGEATQLFLLAHPYSLLGGSSYIMLSLASRLSQSCSAVCLAFDMRGSGSSQGRASVTGNSEIADVSAAAQWLRVNFFELSSKLFIIGYSAGACISGSAAASVNPLGYIGIAYPCGLLASVIFRCHPARLREFTGSKLFLLGTDDCFTSEYTLRSNFGDHKSSEFHIVDLAGHFDIIKLENELCAAISNFTHRVSLDLNC